MDEAGTNGGNGDVAPGGAPLGGVIRDPRQRRPRNSVTGYLRSRANAGATSVLVATGLRRRQRDDGTLEPRAWGRLGSLVGLLVFVLLVWTSVHVVAPGTVSVPVTLGHPGKPLKPGVHLTLPFTTAYSMSVRTQNYTMSSSRGEGQKANVDDSVAVLGADGGAANINATVLYKLDPRRATDVYRTLGTNYSLAVVRPSARTCIRSEFTNYAMVDAATTAWHNVERNVTRCMQRKLGPKGLVLQDFQLREVSLSKQLQAAVNQKVAAQQNAEQQKYELATALQAADITRVQALATADAQQILACGGQKVTIDRDGQRVDTVVPNPISQCSQSQLTPQYLQFTYIQALKQLVNAPNNTTIILPFDQNLTPLLNVPGGATTPTTRPR